MQGLIKYKLTNTETLVLEIESSFIKQEDDLSKMLGIEFKPTKMYRFKNSNLISEEKLYLAVLKFEKKELLKLKQK